MSTPPPGDATGHGRGGGDATGPGRGPEAGTGAGGGVTASGAGGGVTPPVDGAGAGTGVTPPGADAGAHRAGRGALALVSVLAVYYAVPVGTLPSGIGIVVTVAALLAGVALLAWLTVRQVQRLARRTGDEAVRVDSLVFLVVVVVPMFALGFFALNDADPDQFVSLETKTDALYFALSTLATVGFGDVHAAGQLARGLVTLQIAFNLVIVATAASLLTAQIRARAAAGRGGGDRPDG